LDGLIDPQVEIMAKKKKNIKKKPSAHKSKTDDVQVSIGEMRGYYLCHMSKAPVPGGDTNVFQLVPAAFFTAFVIMIVRLHNYTRDMTQYYWSSGNSNLSDFFSYYKTLAVFMCVILIILLLLYRVFVQKFYIKRSIIYIPALVYILFVLISYAFSSEKDIAWMGWNDRFEGTLILMCYIFVAFYIMNIVNSEKGVKAIIYPLAGSSFILSLLGISQATDKDFFRTVIGQKMLVPNNPLENGSTTWQMIDEYAAKGEQFLQFTFQDREIYQTVYNINYVSFYLTLLIPIFGLLFIHEKGSIIKKIMWGLLFGLTFFNLIGSASSGGILGMFVVVVMAVILFNKKILTWWKPLVILVVLVLAIGGITFDRWSGELASATGSILNTTSSSEQVVDPAENEDEMEMTVAGTSGHKFDYFANKGNTIEFSLDGNKAVIDLSKNDMILINDEEDNPLQASQDPATGIVSIDDERFSSIMIQPTSDQDGNSLFIIALNGEGRTWTFTFTEDGVALLNDLENTVKLENVPHIGFKDNPAFGSGRGYIWSRSLPMISDTIFAGHGADTYCVNFPHKDYVGKYNAGWNINMVVDKPHNMYIGIAINTGLLSLIALLFFFGIYLVQSFKIYFRNKIESFASYTGSGIFLGICGFLVAGLVNDSTVSVMPMFYGLLGTGIAINTLIKKTAIE